MAGFVGDVHDGIAQMRLLASGARLAMVGTKAIATLSTGHLNARSTPSTACRAATSARS